MEPYESADPGHIGLLSPRAIVARAQFGSDALEQPWRCRWRLRVHSGSSVAVSPGCVSPRIRDAEGCDDPRRIAAPSTKRKGGPREGSAFLGICTKLVQLNSALGQLRSRRPCRGRGRGCPLSRIVWCGTEPVACSASPARAPTTPKPVARRRARSCSASPARELAPLRVFRSGSRGSLRGQVGVVVGLRRRRV